MKAALNNPAVLFIKKLGGLMLIVAGALLCAYATYSGQTVAFAVGGLLILLGAVLWALKIAKRNSLSGKGRPVS